jgi:hypothetical protein
VFWGYGTHLIFINLLVFIFNLDVGYTLTLLQTQLTGFPEIDMLTPLIITALSPLLFLATNPILVLLATIPWVFAGVVTALVFGPQHDRSIMLAPPIFMGSILLLFFFLIFSLVGVGPSLPSIGILYLILQLLIVAIPIWIIVFLLSLPMTIPALVGYGFGKRYSSRAVPPQIFLAQPDRQDTKQTRCQFLSSKNDCNVGKTQFNENICLNRWNFVTCSSYLGATIKEKRIKKPEKEEIFIDELK